MGGIFGSVYHTIYVLAVWVYINTGMTTDLFLLLQSIFDSNALLMRLCGIGFTLLGGVLFFAVIKGKTSLPKYACVFNMMIVYMIISIIDFPGHLSTGCIVMFSAILFFEKKLETKNN